MSNQTQTGSRIKNAMRSPLEGFRHLLLKRQKEVEKEIKELEKGDPLTLSEGAVAESSEPGTDSWLADTHSRAVAVKQNLERMLVHIKKSLEALRKGRYGSCESCGKQIEEERLKAMPTATLCVACSKKASKKR